MATVQAVMGNLTASDRQILTAVNTGASTLSLLGSGFIVMCYLCFKELRKFSFKLVFFLALSDMLYSFFSIVGDPSKGFFCYAQGYSTHFFCAASFLWTTTIAFTLHRTVVKHKTDVEDMEPIFHLYVWGMNFMLKTFQRFIPMTSFYDIAERLPAVYGFFCHLNFKSVQSPFDRILEMMPTIVVVVTRHLRTPLTPTCQSRSTWHPRGGTSVVLTVMRSIGNDHGHSHLGNVGAWCWTQIGRTGKAVHFMTFYLPLWGAIIFNGVTYFQVIRMLNNATRMAVGMSNRTYQLDMRADMKALNRWGYYPLILIGSWTFGTINRIHDFIEPGHKIMWLSILDVGMAALMGLFNSVAYGLNSSVRRAIYERLDLLPERFRRGLPLSFQPRSLQQDSELISLKVQDEQ